MDNTWSGGEVSHNGEQKMYGTHIRCLIIKQGIKGIIFDMTLKFVLEDDSNFIFFQKDEKDKEILQKKKLHKGMKS